jgi:hypothetical protein
MIKINYRCNLAGSDIMIIEGKETLAEEMLDNFFIRKYCHLTLHTYRLSYHSIALAVHCVAKETKKSLLLQSIHVCKKNSHFYAYLFFYTVQPLSLSNFTSN